MIKTKPTGPIPPGYETIDGELAIGGKKASVLVQDHGSPLFVYSAAMLDARMTQLRAAMPDSLNLHYAMKANPYQPLLRHMVGVVDGVDIASGGELRMALDAGAAPEKISFAGPGKRDDELREAIKAGVTLISNLRANVIGRCRSERPRAKHHGWRSASIRTLTSRDRA